ncbi:MAG: hypothetical protein WD965_06430 [Actinomycetota bacterium]
MSDFDDGVQGEAVMLGAREREPRAVNRLAMLSLLVVLVVTTVGLILQRDQQSRPSHVPVPTGEGDYPDEWKTTLEDARAKVSFDVVLPDHATASRESITDVFVWPEGHAVAIRFPAPAPISDKPVRQGYVEVFESPWTGGDPAKAWAEDVAASDIVGEGVIDIEGLPALTVPPNSPTDIEGANPAFLRFVYEGLDIQISGGDDLNSLIDIATTMIR